MPAPDFPALDWQAVARRRAGTVLGDPLIYRAVVDSTNALAAVLPPSAAPPGTVVVADQQTAGRGRLQRRWLAAPGSALTFTAILAPVDPAWMLPMAAGLAVVEALAALDLAATLKWPNDVLVAGKKCAGILIETRKVGPTWRLLAGIGVNVHGVDPSLPLATYLDAYAAAPIHREDLLVRLLDTLARILAAGAADPTALRTAWRARLTHLGGGVSVYTPEGRLEGLAEDVAEDGGLVVRLSGGAVRVVQAGDVTLTRPYSA